MHSQLRAGAGVLLAAVVGKTDAGHTRGVIPHKP